MNSAGERRPSFGLLVEGHHYRGGAVGMTEGVKGVKSWENSCRTRQAGSAMAVRRLQGFVSGVASSVQTSDFGC